MSIELAMPSNHLILCRPLLLPPSILPSIRVFSSESVLHIRASLVAQLVKNLPPVQETQVRFLGGKIPWRRKWQLTPVFLPGESHGWRSLVCCSPWGREESDKSEQLYFHFSSIGEGNGNPLQCSCCLENPRDGGAWWAAFYGVTQSRTRLK